MIGKLFSYLQSSGSLSPADTIENFTAKMQDKGQREALHAYMVDPKNGLLSSGDQFADFDRAMGSRPMTFQENVGNIAGKAGATALNLGKIFDESATGTVSSLSRLASRMIPGKDVFEDVANRSDDYLKTRSMTGNSSVAQGSFGGAVRRAGAGDIVGAAGEAASATMEAGVGSLPGMAVAATPVVGGALFAASLAEDMAVERAKNRGASAPNAGDFLASVPSALVSAMLEKVGIKGLKGNPLPKMIGDKLSVRYGKDAINALAAGVIEGKTEAEQQILQYVTEIVGTKKAFDWQELATQAGTAAAGGLGVGGAIGFGSSAARKPTARPDATPAPAPAIRPIAKAGAPVRSAVDAAIVQQESSGNANAYNKSSGATGVYQITQSFLDDANRFMGTAYSLADMRTPSIAQKVKDSWHKHYAAAFAKDNHRQPTDEEMAMMHHGGPKGYLRQDKKDSLGVSNARYAREVIAKMHAQRGAPSSERRAPAQLPGAATAEIVPDRADVQPFAAATTSLPSGVAGGAVAPPETGVPSNEARPVADAVVPPEMPSLSMPKIPGVVRGKRVPVIAGGKNFGEVEYRLVEKGSIIASHDSKTFTENRSYPQARQNRDYTDREVRGKAEDAIDGIKRNNYMTLLQPGYESDAGMPTIGPDGVVLSGNNRTFAIQRHYEKYKEALDGTDLSPFGMDQADLRSMAEPVLVRVMADESLAPDFVIASNITKVKSLSTAEIRKHYDALPEGKRTQARNAIGGIYGEFNKDDAVRLDTFLGNMELSELPAVTRQHLLDSNVLSDTDMQKNRLTSTGIEKVKMLALSMLNEDMGIPGKALDFLTSEKEGNANLDRKFDAAIGDLFRLRADQPGDYKQEMADLGSALLRMLDSLNQPAAYRADSRDLTLKKMVRGVSSVDVPLNDNAAVYLAGLFSKTLSSLSNIVADKVNMQASLFGPGASNVKEDRVSYEQRRFGERVQQSETVPEEIKKLSGKRYYRPISHAQTDEDAMKYAAGKDAFSVADEILDLGIPMEPRVRQRLGMIVAEKLSLLAMKSKKTGNTEMYDKASNRAADVYEFIGEYFTALGQAVDIARTFDLDNPATIIRRHKEAVDKAREPVQVGVDEVVDEVNSVVDEAAGAATESGATRSAVARLRARSSSDKGIWARYVSSISESMDVIASSAAVPAQAGALAEFARIVRRTFLSKIPAPPKAEAERKPGAVYSVRDQIANGTEMSAAWEAAREEVLASSPNAEELQALIPEHLNGPFSTADIRRVLREMGHLTAARIAGTWGPDRKALTDAVVGALMQDQPISASEYIETERALRTTIDEIIDNEKSRRTKALADMAEARARKAALAAENNGARDGGPLGGRVLDSSARALAGKLSSSLSPKAGEPSALQVFSRNLVSALRQNIPAKDGASVPKSDAALIVEAIQNKEKYADAWQRAKDLALSRHPGSEAEVNAVFSDLQSVLPRKSVRALIAAELDADMTSLRRLVGEHFSAGDRAGKALAEKIASRLEVSVTEAEEVARIIEREFRAMSSEQVASRLKSLSRRSPAARRVLNGSVARIIELSNLGALADKDVYSAVSAKLRLPDYTPEIVHELTALASAVQAAGLDQGDFGHSVEYWVARKALLDYLLLMHPSHNLKVLTGVVSRGFMLMSIKSPVTNIIGNSVLAVTESLSRRLVAKSVNGLNGDFALEYFRHVNSVFQKSGYDPTRMLALDEDQQRLGEDTVNSHGPGAVRATGRFVEDIVFKQLMGAPDVAFSAAHFVDSANINSTKVARAEGGSTEEHKARSLDVFKDAVRVSPMTAEGRAVRDLAVSDAMRATLTDSSWASTASLKIRELLNTLSGDLRLGDLRVPFAKTPANVVMRLLESSGVLLPVNLWQILKGRRDGDLSLIRSGLQGAVAAGLGLLGAELLASILGPDDYIGDYLLASDSERALIKSLGGTYNAIRVGSSWVSMDYFGPIAGPLVGILSARKYGASPLEAPMHYVLAVGRQCLRIPGAKEIAEVWTEANNLLDPKTELTEKSKDFSIGLVDFAVSRIIPAFVSDVAAALDSSERSIDYSRPDGAAQLVARKIPGLRESTPERIDLFSDPVSSQSWMAALAFGARFRTGRGSSEMNELQRLNAGGELPTLDDISRTSSRVKALEAQVGPARFRSAVKSFGSEFKSGARSMLSGGEIGPAFEGKTYSQLPDDEKKEAWNALRKRAINMMLSEYGYRKASK